MNSQDALALDAFIQSLQQALAQLPGSTPSTLAAILNGLAAAMRARTASALATTTVDAPKPPRRLP